METVVPKQSRSVRTKSIITSTAKKLFSEFGYYDVTTNKIAKEAGIPIGSIYNYFKDKKSILLALITSFNQELYDGTIHKFLDSELKIKSKKDALLFIHFAVSETLSSSHYKDPFYRIIHALQFTDQEVLQLSEEIREKEIAVITKILEGIQHFHLITNVELKAKLIHSTIENVGLYMHPLGTSLNSEELIEETAQMIFAYLFSTND